MESIETYRTFLRGDLWGRWSALERDQAKGVPAPPAQKPCPDDAARIDLVAPSELTVGAMPLIEAIRRRKSRRRFSSAPLSLEELSFLLWATQGLREGAERMRTVPSAGGRHPFETYLSVHRVEGLEPGLYRYLPSDHQLCFLRDAPGLPAQVTEGCNGQTFAGESAVVFIWTAIPYRTEWRYSIISHKMIAIDAGHLCQNLYLACESIGAGTCGIGAYNHTKMDAIVDVDSQEEFVVYVAPVGKIE